MQSVHTLIVGAGQAGLALSRLLTEAALGHVVLERGRVGERWRSERWDSLALLTPNWANRLPGEREAADPDGFLSRREFVTRLESYAGEFQAPVLEGTTVTRIEPAAGGFRVRTARGDWHAANVVLASGDCAVPALPWFAGAAPSWLHQVHSSSYRSPAALPAGAVMVVGAGASGHQIAHELAAAGREVVFAVGSHARILRRYRGRDVWSWLHELGDLSRTRHDLSYDPRSERRPALPLDGRDGGRTIDLAGLAAMGVRVTGRLKGFAAGTALLAADLSDSVARAEQQLRRLLARIDSLARSSVEPEDVPPIVLPEAPTTVDLAAAGIGTIVWATGFRPHHPFVDVPGALGGDGSVVEQRGVTPVPGLYVLGARWQWRLTSHQIGGVGADARFLARRLADSTVARAA